MESPTKMADGASEPWRCWRIVLLAAMVVCLCDRVSAEPSINQDQAAAAQPADSDVQKLLQAAKVLYEAGKYDEAETVLREVLGKTPSNEPAKYYSDWLEEARLAALLRDQRGGPHLVSGLVYSVGGRKEIISKLDSIRLNEVSYYNLPLYDVLMLMCMESRQLDPGGEGINFMFNPHFGAPDGAFASTVDTSKITVKIDPPLRNIRLADVLDAITNAASVPIQYSIENYAVVFSPRSAGQGTLHTKVFKVNPNAFVQTLQNVVAINLIPGTQGSGTGVQIPSVQISLLIRNGYYVTKTNNSQAVNALVKDYLIVAGVNLNDPGKAVFYNDRLGELLVRGSLQDLEIVEQAVELLNDPSPQQSGKK